MELERERGITIKSHPISLSYKYKKKEYTINLIDTPGHIDFSNEVLRGLIAAEGAILLVDVSKGVQPQTLFNAKLAVENNLKIIPILNKSDLVSCKGLSKGYSILEDVTGTKYADLLRVSSKKKLGLDSVLEKIIEDVPAPFSVHKDSRFRALIFDSTYDEHVGLTFYIKVYSGTLNKNDRLVLVNKDKPILIVKSLGFFNITKTQRTPSFISEGGIGFITIRIKKDIWD
jgi:GTP-binding protein LepA